MKRIRLATYLVLGLSVVFPLSFLAYNFVRYGFSELLGGYPQPIITIAVILFALGPYAFAAFMVALLPKNKASSITVFVGSLLVSAVSWLSVFLPVWRHFRYNPAHDMQIAARLIWVIAPCCQWPLVFITVAIAYLLGGRAFRKQTMLMFVGIAFLFTIFWLSVTFYIYDEFTMALSCWLGLLVVVVLVFLLAHTKPRLAKAET